MVLKFLKSSFDAIKTALKKTRDRFADRLRHLFSGQVNEEMLEELEMAFYEADLGVKTAKELTLKTESFLRKNKTATSDDTLTFLENELVSCLAPFDYSLKLSPTPGEPTCILIVGTNGNGKTTSIAKLAKLLQDQGKTVLLAAADTFRAGAQEQLELWAKKLNLDIVMGTYNGDPAAVAFDALKAAKTRGIDFVLIDTAGRLENKSHLMKELEKIKRILQKQTPSAPHETLLVLDATIGQNGLQYAKTFGEFVPLTGIVLTKIDGTAKGGTAITIQKELGIPIKFLGTGEKVDDFSAFDPKTFVHSLFFSE
jgi:fused signal recognition particle receptor